MKDIADWRNCIDDIDSQLLRLLNERARCACEIGCIKEKNGMTVYNPDRERAILSKLGDKNKGPLADSAIQKIFETIIEQCRSLEKEKK
ncbi:chorismate mutase [Candidatus Omnitrophota bacterium]